MTSSYGNYDNVETSNYREDDKLSCYKCPDQKTTVY